MKLLYSIAALLILTSCANVPSDYKLDPQKPAGLVVGSITYESSVGLYRIGIVPVGAAPGTPGSVKILEVGNLQWHPFIQQRDEELNAKGGTFAVEVPAGEYRIAFWSVAQGPRHSTSTSPIGIPFTVESGKSTYLGSFNWSAHWDNISLRDHSKRDLPILQSRFLALKTSPITVAIAPGTYVERLGGDYRYQFNAPLFLPIPAR